jgi:hypothetical protein
MPDITPGQKLIAANEAGLFSHPSELAKAIDAAIAGERDACAKVAEAMQKDFLSSRYATGQPLSSFGERFACGQIAAAIRARSPSPAPVKEGVEQ